MARVLILGAGALGKGAIAPLLLKANHEVVFVDNDPQVNESLREVCEVLLFGGEISAYRYQAPCCLSLEEIGVQVDLVITCTRPIAPEETWEVLRGWGVPVVLLENDTMVPGLAGENFWPGVADILSHESQTCYSEDASLGRGRICLDQRVELILGLVPGFVYLKEEELSQLWAARFLTHNTGHAVLAYLGAARGHKLVSDAAWDSRVSVIAKEAMHEAGLALEYSPDLQKSLGVKQSNRLHEFWYHYYETEISRYRYFLPDTIARVARDPLRKLARDERLLGPAYVYWSYLGQKPEALLMGIRAALEYSNLAYAEVLGQICGLGNGDPFRQLIEGDDVLPSCYAGSKTRWPLWASSPLLP